MQDVKLNQFNLVGGTALALQIAHRTSIDIDLFTKEKFDPASLNEYLKKKYDFQFIDRSNGTLLGTIKEIKIDVLQHLYPELTQPVIMESIRMASPLDIAAMKLNAIANNGTRIKDYVDMAYFSSQMSLKQMILGYEKKYNAQGVTALRSLTYFNDIDFKEKVDLISGEFKWETIDKRLNEMMKNPEQVFSKLQMSGLKK